jgi:acyl dehydratase
MMDTAAPASSLSLEEFTQRIGTLVAVSEWCTVDQSLIDRFAAVTGDRYFIHTDPVRAAAETPYGGTIAHGMLVLSLLSDLGRRSLPVCRGLVGAVNYGYDRVRFLTPVPSGSRIRAHFTLADVRASIPTQVLMRYQVAIEIAGQPRHAIALEWLCLIFLAGD